MADTTCSTDKKRTASVAFPSSAEREDTKKAEESLSLNNNGDSGKGKSETTAPSLLLPTPPSIEECVCYLEKNPTMRRIIGLLIERESSEKKESNSEVNKETDRTSYYSSGHGDDDDDSWDEQEELQRCFNLVNDSKFCRFDLNEKDDDVNLEYSDADTSNSDIEEDCNDEEVVVPPSVFPTLQQLAFNASSEQLRVDAKRNEQKYQNLLLALPEETQTEISEADQIHQKQVRESSELATIRLLCSLQTYARQKLIARFQVKLDGAKARRVAIVENAKSRQAEIKRNWVKERQSILDEHCSFVEEYGDYAGHGESVLCSSPKCRKLFDPDLLPQDKTCWAWGCVSKSKTTNCGCCIKPCCARWRCKHYTCRDHFREHAEACNKSRTLTCGHTLHGDVDRKGGYCNRVFNHELKEECVRCGARCCPDCLRKCGECDYRTCVKCQRDPDDDDPDYCLCSGY